MKAQSRNKKINTSEENKGASDWLPTAWSLFDSQ
jgi:hypothetical protein